MPPACDDTPQTHQYHQQNQTQHTTGYATLTTTIFINTTFTTPTQCTRRTIPSPHYTLISNNAALTTPHNRRNTPSPHRIQAFSKTGVRNVSPKRGPLFATIFLSAVVILTLVICPCLSLPLRRPPNSKNKTPFSVECREVLLCWVVQIQTHAMHCGDDGGANSPTSSGDSCLKEKQRLVEEHAVALSQELGLEIQHTFGQFHDHLLLCLDPTTYHFTQLDISSPSMGARFLVKPQGSTISTEKSSASVPRTVKGKATSTGISHLHKLHSDLRVKDERLFDLWRREVEVKLAEHPEVVTFSSEHVHLRKSRLAIPPRISGQAVDEDRSDSVSQNTQTSDLTSSSSSPPELTSNQDNERLPTGRVSLKHLKVIFRETKESVNKKPKDTLSGIDQARTIASLTKSSKDHTNLPVISIPKSFISSLSIPPSDKEPKSIPSISSSPKSLPPSYLQSMSVSSVNISFTSPEIDTFSNKGKLSFSSGEKQSINQSSPKRLVSSLNNSNHSFVNSRRVFSQRRKQISTAIPNMRNVSLPLAISGHRNNANHQNPFHLRLQALNKHSVLSRRLPRSVDTSDHPLNRPLSLWLLKWPQKRSPASTTKARSLKNFEKLYPNDKPKAYEASTTPTYDFDLVARGPLFLDFPERAPHFPEFPEFLESPSFRRHSRKRRETVVLLPPMAFNDPAYPRQWHLYNRATPGMDINVTGVWRHNITGSGVTVAVVDDGVEWRNPDLKANYNYKGSWDLNDGDPDPSPSYVKTSNHHGTRCAGEIAAVANNNVCGVGVAYGANIAGVRVLDGVMTDSMEAEAFNKNMHVNAIFSCSWGPDDDGTTVDGPHLMAAKAMKFGVDFGRGGFGSVFVVASGNGGENGDNCNFDGYANSIYTVTIGAVDENGGMPYYAEECASMLGVTFSSGTLNKRDIVTTDWEPSVFGDGGGILGSRSVAEGGVAGARMGGGVASRSASSTSGGGVYRGASSNHGNANGDGGCTERHTGTSAAAPLAAGMIALMLEARPCLTWRDVQYVVALTARKVDVEVAHWQNNGAGLAHSHKHGFGLLSAWRLVNAARVWKTVPWLTSYSYTEESRDWSIPKGHRDPLTIVHTVTARDIQGLSLFILEHVQLTVWLSHPWRGNIEVKVVSPAGTVSTLAATRHKDNSSNGFNDWTFTTVRCWGETPTGEWTILVTDHDELRKFDEGRLSKYRLTLFGTPMTPEEFQERRKTVEAAMTGEFLQANYTLNCPPPPKYQSVYAPVSERVLKIIILSGIFLLVMAIYETFEYIFCYDDEKKEAKETIKAARRAARSAQEAVSIQDEEEFVQLTSAFLAQQSSENADPFERNSNNSSHNFSRPQISNTIGDNIEEDNDDEDDFLDSSETSRLLTDEPMRKKGDKGDIRRGFNLNGWGRGSVSVGRTDTGLSHSPDVIQLRTFSVCEGERFSTPVEEEGKVKLSDTSPQNNE